MADNKDEKEIDLFELARKLWDNKKFIIKVTLIGAVVGLIIAFSIPKEYTSTVVFTTNTNQSTSSNMGALASLAGINLNTQPSESFSPELYSDIISSTPFVQGLLDVRVLDQTLGIDTTLRSYFRDKQSSPWWSYIVRLPNLLLNLFKPTENSKHEEVLLYDPYYISGEDMTIINQLRSSYTITTDKKTRTIKVEVSSQSPEVSALLADTLTSHLQDYIIKARTKKATMDLQNTVKLCDQLKKEYYDSQKKLASFIDANQNLISAKYKINQEKLQNEVGLAYSVYNQMAQQQQMAQIKVQDDTPVFTIIQPAIKPLYPEKPKKKMIIVSFVFITVVAASLWTLRKNIFKMFFE